MLGIIDILADYLEIYNRYSPNIYLNKAQKKEQHNDLMKWAKQEYQIMPDIEEVRAFMLENDMLKYEQPFFLKVVMPCVLNDINKENIQSLLFLFECNGTDDRRIGTDRDYVYIFCLGTNFQYNTWNLADMVLSKEPDNKTVLYYKYKSIKRFLEYSIHEIPLGVLSGIGGAEKEDMPDMNMNLREFIYLSEKLCKEDTHLIEKCTIMYKAWEQYIDNIEKYNSFEDYLTKQN